MATTQDVHKAMAFLLNGMVERMAKRNIDQHRVPLLDLLGPNTKRIYGDLIISRHAIGRELRQLFAYIIEDEIRAYPHPRLIVEGGNYFVEFYDADKADEIEFTRARRFGSFETMHASFRRQFDEIAQRGRNFDFDMGFEMIDTTIPAVTVDYGEPSPLPSPSPVPVRVESMRGINTSEELQDVLRVSDAETRFHLDTASLPDYEGECYDGDSQQAWRDDGRPQLLLNVGHTAHSGHTVVFFENITHGSGLHVMAIFAGDPRDVNAHAAPVECFRVQGRGGVPVEIRLPGDDVGAALVMVPQYTDQCIKPIWYARKA